MMRSSLTKKCRDLKVGNVGTIPSQLCLATVLQSKHKESKHGEDMPNHRQTDAKRQQTFALKQQNPAQMGTQPATEAHLGSFAEAFR